ncbi:MAG: 50S ribosomal protein L25/general stress protein Ctc [Methylomonas sp.]|nr:MAG: 50S ribosomal protein L25/general stress protein Ctc [Methylomonas sp.]PPD24692.1 MAG: 50S ribosomal protein L25/general stress protein Ctc [Methylomonas sp.]PPD39801.1 MAG: 50S ribosomal protein L25/general stress protein Ctc [Methylomonas sp.]PPD51379.1 MAG: 50S ribosomal protein L25/general stress protein Ctc [Methylomonas sp.]
MANVFEFVAEDRCVHGTSAAKAVRRQGKVPAVVYGGGAAPASLALDHNEVLKRLEHEAVYSHVLDLKVGERIEKAVLKQIQRHPAKPQILHMDFMRISESDLIKVRVPLHFVNESGSVGVKKGGVVAHSMADVEVSCFPSNLPEFIEVDLSSFDMGAVVHLDDLVLPTGVALVALQHGPEHNHLVVQILKPRGADEG